MNISIRLDDITPDMDWEKFERMEALLDGYRIRPLLGVVPNNQDDALSRGLLREDFQVKLAEWRKKGWRFAMHGWEHCYVTGKGGLFPLNRFSEFAGLSLDEQRGKIRRGREMLKAKYGLETDIFMAPAHSYDKHTLAALREEGFCYVTDGFGAWPYRYKGLVFLPIAFRRSGDIQKKNGYTTVIFHVNTMTEKDFQEAEALFRDYGEGLLAYGDYLKVEPKDRGFPGRLWEYLLASLKRFLVFLRKH